MPLTTRARDLSLASATEVVLANQELLGQLRSRDWLPAQPEEIIAALWLLADKFADVATPDLAELDPALGGTAARPAMEIGKDE
jgi:hypothetical protein